jgi:hypothetical protein
MNRVGGDKTPVNIRSSFVTAVKEACTLSQDWSSVVPMRQQHFVIVR